MDFILIIIAVLGGFIAGAINTLAGNGSAITLSIMTELMGLPGNIANATNRVGVQMQGIATSFAFIKNGRGLLKGAKYLIFVAIIGALAGVYVAIIISNEQFKVVFKYLLVVMLLAVVINPKRWLIKHSDDANLHPLLGIPAFLLLGFYGGFIQMGMGVIFLMITVIVMRINIIDANAMKTYIVAIYTVVVLFIFHLKGLVDWEIGLIFGLGQMTGGYLTGEFASRYPNSEIWAYRILVAVIILAILSTFGVFPHG